MPYLDEILGSKTRAEIFRLLFERNDHELYLRELQRRSGMSVRPVQEELSRLSKIGLIKSRQDGNRLYYRANTEHPLFPEIRGLVEKTSGIQALLQQTLHVPEIKIAFIFGSVASGKARPDSDLDLFIVGNIGLRKVTGLLSGLTDRIGRLVNPHVMSTQEFARRVHEKNHLISNVISSEKVFVVGDENELKRLAEK